MKRIITYILIVFLWQACTYEFPDTSIKNISGSADFSKFICIGDNYTSGFMDGALYSDGQKNSIGSLIAGQLGKVSGELYHQADIESETGYNLNNSDSVNVYGKLIRVFSSLSASDPVIIALPGELPSEYTGDKYQLSDFSVPFMKSYQLKQQELSSNIYYKRIATIQGSSTLIEQAISSGPSFFVFWVGMYDALRFAMSGAIGNDDPPADQELIMDLDLTPEDVFENSIRQAVYGLLSDPMAKGVVLNLPTFEDLPYFYYYQYNFIKLPGNQKFIAQQSYAEYNQAVTLHNQIPGNETRPYISFNDNGETPYPQPVVVIDDLLSDGVDLNGNPLPKYRHLQPDEMVLLSLPFDQVEYGLGSIIPLEKKYYLNSFEIQKLNQTIDKYNDVLSQVVAENQDQLILADLHSQIKILAATARVDSWGIPDSFELFYQNGLPLNADLSMNSIFSLDGLHFNQRGNAYVANLIIEVINLHFGSNISLIEVNQYSGNTIVLDNN